MRLACPSSAIQSYLDDRLLFVRNWKEADAAVKATQKIDECIGPVLNVAKSSGAASKLGRTKAQRPLGILCCFPEATMNTYLGVDIALDGGKRIRKRIAGRIDDYKRRCDIAAYLPACSRDSIVADAASALYAMGGCGPCATAMAEMSSRSGSALYGAGRKAKQKHSRRNRLVTHLIGCGPHRTHPAASTVYSWVTQALRMHADGYYDVQGWRDLFLGKRSAVAGPAYMIKGALADIGIDWNEAYHLQCGTHDFNFEYTAGVNAYSGSRDFMKSKAGRKIRRNLREFLRLCVARKLSIDRPKDYGCLSDGWVQHESARQAVYQFWHHPGGRSLLSAGIWTRINLHRVNGSSTTSQRCMCEDETLEHRLWKCSANAPFLDALRQKLGDKFDHTIASRPASVARTGMFCKSTTTPASDQHSVLEYLSDVQLHAMQSDVAINAGYDPPVPEPGRLTHIALANLTRRELQGKLAPRRNRTKKIAIPDEGAQRHCSCEHTVVAVDGGCEVKYSQVDCVAGWGMAVQRPCGSLTYRCGRVVTDPDSPLSFGADKETNNTAEITALCELFQWLIRMRNLLGKKITAIYDSTYAAMVVRKFWRPRTNIGLILTARRLLDTVNASYDLEWKKCSSHRGHFRNEIADQAATLGAQRKVEQHMFFDLNVPESMIDAAQTTATRGPTDDRAPHTISSGIFPAATA